jgi:hypothetical protein
MFDLVQGVLMMALDPAVFLFYLKQSTHLFERKKCTRKYGLLTNLCANNFTQDLFELESPASSYF